MNYLQFFIFLILFVLCCESAGLVKGKTRVEVEMVQKCRHMNSAYDFSLKFERFNRTHRALSMNVTLLDDFDSTISLHIQIQTWSDGGWKDSAVNIKAHNVCESARKLFGKFWVQIEDSLGSSGCPIKKGYYSMKDFYVDIDSIPIMVFKGKFRTITKFTKNDKVLLCFDATATIKDKL